MSQVDGNFMIFMLVYTYNTRHVTTADGSCCLPVRARTCTTRSYEVRGRSFVVDIISRVKTICERSTARMHVLSHTAIEPVVLCSTTIN